MTAFHSMSKALSDCKKCDASDSLLRMPSNFFYQSTEINQNYKVGDLVEKAIDDFKLDLEEEKEQINKEEWKPND